MNESKKIDTSIEMADLLGPCGTCHTTCLENCAASLDSFSDISLEIDGEIIPIKHGCVDFSNIEPIVLKAQTKVEDFISSRVPYLKDKKYFTKNNNDGVHTNALKKVKYRYSNPCPADDSNSGGGGGSYITDCVQTEGGGYGVNDGGSSFPSIDYGKRHLFGDDSFFLEVRTIVSYIDSYTIYFMCADDVDVEATDSYGNYEDWKKYEEYYMTPADSRSGSEPSVSGGGLADFSQFLQASKDEVLDSTPMPANGERVTSAYARAYKPSITIDTAPTEDSLKKNLQVISIKPSTNILKSNRSLWKHGTAHGRFWFDNFRKGYEDENYSEEDRPDTAHFKVDGEEGCSIVVVKSTHKITLGNVNEYMSPTGNRYCSFVSKSDFRYIDPSSGECTNYMVGETLPKEEWTESCEFTLEAQQATHSSCPSERTVERIFTIKGLPLTVDEVVSKVSEEFMNKVAGNQVLDLSSVDVPFGVEQSYNPEPQSWLNFDRSGPMGYANHRLLPARNTLDSIQRIYTQTHRMTGSTRPSETSEVFEVSPLTKAFVLKYSESLKDDGSESRSWTQGCVPQDTLYQSVDDLESFGWSPSSTVRLTDAHEEISGWYNISDFIVGQQMSDFSDGQLIDIGSGAGAYINTTYGDSGARAGIVPKSYQIELFLTSGCNVTNSEVYHVNFKPSEIAPSSKSLLRLDKKHSTDWTIHNAGTCVAQPNRYLGDAKFDSFSTQEEAYISWSSFCAVKAWYNAQTGTIDQRYVPSPYLSAFNGNLSNIITTNTSTSVNMFCVNDDKYWQECHHKEYTIKTPGLTDYGDFVITSEVIPEWKSIAYTGQVSLGGGPTRQGDISQTQLVEDFPSHCTHVTIQDYICPSGKDQHVAGKPGPYSLDEQRVNNDTIIDYMHMAYENRESRPSETWDTFFTVDDSFSTFFESGPEEDSPLAYGHVHLNDDLGHKDVRYIQIRKKDGNRYGVSSFDASYSFSALTSFETSDYTVPDCAGWDDGSTKWPTHSSCPWWMYFVKDYPATFTCNDNEKVGHGVGGYRCGNFIFFRGNMFKSHTICVTAFDGTDVPFKSGTAIPFQGTPECCCVADLDGCPDAETNNDHTSPFDSGYKWWWYFNLIGCADTSNSLSFFTGKPTKSIGCFNTDNYEGQSQFCELPDYAFTTSGPVSLNPEPYFGQVAYSWSAPSCTMIDYVNPATVDVQPITIKILGQTTSSPSSLNLELNKEGI